MRFAIGVAVACLSIIGLSSAADVEAAIKRHTDISAQGLGPALRNLAKEHGFQIVYASKDVSDLRTQGVVGEFTITEALSRLLTGTSLTYRYLDDKTITIAPLSIWEEKSADAGTRMQVAQVDSTQSSPSSATVEGPLKSADEDRSKIQEVIVTAQKRVERLQDVPISISVLRGEELDSSTGDGVLEALNRVPGVATMAATQGANQLVIRGVTSTGAFGAGSSTIAYYIDGVTFSLVKHAVVPDSSAYDLERIEILRGPQGTLYGASALGGVVRLLTHEADLNEFDFKARTSVSSTDEGGSNYRGDMAINVPLVKDRLAARAVVGYQDSSGWIDRPNNEDANDSQIANMRLRLDAQPTDNLSIGLSAWLSRSDAGAPSNGIVDYTSPATLDESISTDYDLYGFRVAYDFPGFSLTSVTSYIDYTFDSALDFQAPPRNLADTRLITDLAAETFSQEVLLSSNSTELWRWSLGGMYRDSKDNLFQHRRQYVAYTDIDNTSKSYAVFGEVTRRFLDGQFELTGGLRYFEDEVTGDENQRSDGAPANLLVHAQSTFDAVSPRVVLNWHPQEQLTVYASYSQGFRSGSDQNGSILAVVPAPSTEADTLTNYEIGSKGSLWNGRVDFDAALFYTDWQDTQQVLGVTIGPGNFSVLVNGESASGIGAEFAASVEPVEGLQLGGNVGWNDLTWDSDVISFGTVLFVEGSRLSNSPEYTAGASMGYSFPIGGIGFVGNLSASANYHSAQEITTLTVGGPVTSSGDPMLISRASFEVSSPGHWATTLFIDNLSNENGSPAVPGIPHWATRIRPRTIGVQLEYRFN